MKKFFTLIAAVSAVLSASAQTFSVSSKTDLIVDGQIPAETALINSRKASVKTVFPANAGQLLNEEGAAMTVTMNGYEFTHYMQVRVDAAPTADVPTGTDKGGSTPLVVTPKENVDITFYYRRQAANNAFAAGDGKDMICVKQAGVVKQAGDLTVIQDLGTGYAYVTQTFHLEASVDYTVYGRGTTIQLYAFDLSDYTGGNTGGGEGNNDSTSGIYDFSDASANADGFSQITYGDGAALILSGNSAKSWSNGSSITVNGEQKTSIKTSNGAQNTFVAPAGKFVSKATFYSYVNKDEPARTPYWKEINGKDYSTTDETGAVVPSAEAVIMNCYKDGANPDVIAFELGGVPSFTFTQTGEQVCFVLAVEYGEASGIQNLESKAVRTVKAIRNGQFVIETVNGTFNAAGALVK